MEKQKFIIEECNSLNIQENEIVLIKKSLNRHDTIVKAAKALGITERTLHAKMDKYKLK